MLIRFLHGICIESSADVQVTTADTTPGVTYKWHVRAKNGRNFGRWTAYREIEITP